MTVEFDYLRYDVFTDRPFAGNPLAVVLDPPALSASDRQSIAAEFNLSETVFVSVRESDGPVLEADVSIHTPTLELPFAGHPTIGAAIALAEHRDARDRVVLHETVGPIEVALGPSTGGGRTATLTTAAVPRPVEPADPGDVVACLGLTFDDLHRECGPSAWTAGVPYTMVAVRDLDVLARARVDLATWDTTLALAEAPDIYCVAPLDGLSGAGWRARMFAPGVGIVEDPATGSAAAAFAGYLAGRVDRRRLDEGWVLTQGVEMGRPSIIEVGLATRGNELVGVTVGGSAVAIGRGTMRLPDPTGSTSPGSS